MAIAAVGFYTFLFSLEGNSKLLLQLIKRELGTNAGEVHLLVTNKEWVKERKGKNGRMNE